MGYRYNKLGYVIVTNLKDGYMVMANILRENDDTYDVTLELNCSGIDRWDCLDGQHYHIQSENINAAVCKIIEEKYNSGFFNKFIDRYEYELKCFDRGNELFENERLGE